MLRNPDVPLSSRIPASTTPAGAAPAVAAPADVAQASVLTDDWPLCAAPQPVLRTTEHHAPAPPPTPTPVQGRGHQGVPGAQSYTAPSPTKSEGSDLLVHRDNPGDPRLYKPRKRELRRQRQLEAIAAIDMEVRQAATSIVKAYMGAAELDDGAEKPEGWSDRDYRVAKDGRAPVKQQPGYLAAAVRIAESYQRAAAAQTPVAPPSLNVDVQVLVKQDTYNYPVLDLEQPKKR